MPVPFTINDGNWTLRNYESVEFTFPFSDKGDNVTFKAKCKCRMDKGSFRTLAPMSAFNFPQVGTGFLIHAGEPRDIGCGLYEFWDEYGNVPATRTEYGSFTYTLQVYESIGNSNVDPSKYFYDTAFDIEEQTFTVQAATVFDYFINIPPVPFLKTRYFMLFGHLYTQAGKPNVAEDSRVSIYAGKIFERATPYVDVGYAPIG